jgi:signal transduction histidine kinase
MAVSEKGLTSPASGSSGELAGLFATGVLGLGPGGQVRFADPRALELLGCPDGFALERLWGRLKPLLERAGLSWIGAGGGRSAAVELPVAAAEAPGGEPGAARHLCFELRGDPAGGGVLLVQDLGGLKGLEADLRLASQMRSVSQISPAVAHDLRAPINAMVFAIEILRESIASGRAADPAGREKLLRRVEVLTEELKRLHGGLENFLAFISPRSDRIEPLDLRELAGELASLLVAPARKQQVQVRAELPEEAVPLEGNRYLLRQALLHLALAALSGLPRQSTLVLRLERLDGRALLRVQGRMGSAVAPPAAPAETAGSAFDLQVSPDGARAQLWVARSILAAHGGEARETAGPAAGGPRAYEVEFTVLADYGLKGDGLKGEGAR